MANNPNAKANLKPFTKGDKRINKDGRPATAASLSALARRIAHEPALKKNGAPVIGQDGKPVTKIEAILLQWAQDPKHQGDFVERGFGKVAQAVDLGGTVELEHKHDLSRLDDSELERLAGIVAKLTGNTE